MDKLDLIKSYRQLEGMTIVYETSGGDIFVHNNVSFARVTLSLIRNNKGKEEVDTVIVYDDDWEQEINLSLSTYNDLIKKRIHHFQPNGDLIYVQ